MADSIRVQGGQNLGIKTLKTLRMLIPGLMILLALIALKNSDLISFADRLVGVKISRDSFQFYVVPLVLGALYYVVNLRSVFFRKPIRKIVDNIYVRLLAPFANDVALGAYYDQLRSDPRVKQVFYRFIDAEPDLREKANNVRMNGLVLSSLADAAIIGLMFCPVYVIFYIWKSTRYYLLLAIGALMAFIIIKLFLLPLATRRHIQYSNEQIDSILGNNRPNLKKALLGLVGHDHAD